MIFLTIYWERCLQTKPQPLLNFQLWLGRLPRLNQDLQNWQRSTLPTMHRPILHSHRFPHWQAVLFQGGFCRGTKISVAIILIRICQKGNYRIQFSTDIVVLCDHAALFSYKYGHQVHINDIPIFSNCMRTRRAHAHSDIDACAHIQRAKLARIHTVAHTRNIDTYTHAHIQKLSKVHRQNN